MTTNGYQVSSGGDENILELGSVIAAQPCIYETPVNCTILNGDFYGIEL